VSRLRRESFAFLSEDVWTQRIPLIKMLSMAKQNTTPHQATDRRPGGYPFNSYSTCARFLQTLRECGGASGHVPKSVIASALGVGDSSSGFYSLLASAKTFGMIEGNRDISMSTTARDYVLPDSESQRRLAELSFFEAPAAFRFLIERFDGHELPASVRIGAILLKGNMAPESWAQRVATFFLSMADDLKLIDRGFLRLGVARHEATNGRLGPRVPLDDAGGRTEPRIHEIRIADTIGVSAPTSTTCTTSTTWEHAGVRVTTPEPLAPEVWIKLKKYVEMLEPSSQQQEG
jgi:hypothetical protein